MYQSTHTGAQVDEAVDKALSADAVPTPGSTNLVESGGVASAVSAVQNTVSRRNLLDNWFFANPVNQRGSTSYTASGYTIDRWYSKNTLTASIDSSGLTLNPNGQSNRQFGQKIENVTSLGGKLVTLSVQIVANTTTGGVYGQVFGRSQMLAPAGQTGLFSVQFLLPETISDNEVLFRFSPSSVESGTITIAAVKLELGSVSTLANDAPPNYAEELAKCQRYYWDSGATSAVGLDYSGLAGSAGNNFSISIPTPVSMRTGVTPTITFTISWVRGQGSQIAGFSFDTTNAYVQSGYVSGCAITKTGGFSPLQMYTVLFSKLTVSCEP